MQYQIEQRDIFYKGDGEKSVLELAEGEMVLHSETRGNRVVVFVATPVEVSFECEECGESFDSEHGLKVHEGSQH